MTREFNAQKFVNEIFTERLMYRSCIRNILKNIEKYIEGSGNDKDKIGRLLEMRNYLEKELANGRPEILNSPDSELVRVLSLMP